MAEAREFFLVDENDVTPAPLLPAVDSADVNVEAWVGSTGLESVCTDDSGVDVEKGTGETEGGTG